MKLTEIDKQDRYLYYIAALLFIPAIFLNLGLLSLWADEPIRALVSLEMIISDNYLVSTTNGEYYFHKPPLWNWIVVVFFKLFGTSEFIVRLPAVLSFIAFSIIIYRYTLKNIGDYKVALFTAIAFTTGGNIMFFSSFQGHIDMLYSLVTFISFMVIYQEFEKQRWYRLFIVSYLLVVIGVLLKGLPSFLFQGFTLLAYFTYRKQFKKLFHPAHFAGFGLMAVLIGGYLWMYYTLTDPTTFKTYMSEIWWQSGQRTPINEDKTFWESISYLFKFPLINIQDLAPWSLFIIFLFTKGAIKAIKANPFITYVSIVFIANIWVYWISPDNRPRYIFMLWPLFLTVIVYLYFKLKDNNPKLTKGLNYFFGLLTILVALVMLSPLFIEQIQFISDIYLKVIGLFVLAGIAVYLYFKQNSQHLIVLTISILIARIGFNWFVMPARDVEQRHRYDKENAYKVAEITKDEQIDLLSWSRVNRNISFYIEEKKGQIVGIDSTGNIVKDKYYLTYPHYCQGKDYEKFFEFTTRYLDSTIYLVKFNSTFVLDKQN